MPKITLRPSGREIEVSSEENLFESLRAEGIFLNASCGGYASCSDCRVIVKGGEDNMNPQPFEETQLLGNVFHMTKERLSCQLKPLGDMIIDISLHKNVEVPPAKEGKSNNSRVRKKDEIEAIQKERDEIRAERDQEKEKWFKHWEKDSEGKKKLGGGNRPKLFRTDNLEEKALAEEAKKSARTTNNDPAKNNE